MHAPPLISICIPAYKRPDSLKQLLDSIASQLYTDFEVVVTDDSPDSIVLELCEKYKGRFSLQYFKNQQTFGSPANWNEAVKKANGNWIKLMHDDDWFADKHSLQSFATAIASHPKSNFLFSAYGNINQLTGLKRNIRASRKKIRELLKNPEILVASNVIGPPSCTIYRKRNDMVFDTRLKWLVDLDFYIRYLGPEFPVYLDSVLIHIGVSGSQVTTRSFRNPFVEIPEQFLVLEKIGVGKLRKITLFDAWWRLIRNLGIINEYDIRRFGYAGDIPQSISTIIKFQATVPKNILRIGFFSKLLMLLVFSRTRSNSSKKDERNTIIK
jgi:glycosyltransferase involved in cell wall biosynthesis